MSEIQGQVKLASGEKVSWVLNPNVKVVIGNHQFDGREITTADQVIRMADYEFGITHFLHNGKWIKYR